MAKKNLPPLPTGAEDEQRKKRAKELADLIVATAVEMGNRNKAAKAESAPAQSVPAETPIWAKVSKYAKENGGGNAKALLSQMEEQGALTDSDRKQLQSYEQRQQANKAQYREKQADAFREKAQAAKKTYEEMTAPEEKGAQRRPYAAGAGIADTTGSSYAAGLQDKEYKEQFGAQTAEQKKAKAEADHYQLKAQQAEDAATLQKDRAEFESWPEKDRAMLETYIIESNRERYNLLGEPSFNSARYNATELFDKYGAQKVQEMAESYSRWQNAENAQKMAELSTEAAKEHPVASSIGSVAANVVGAYTSPLGYIGEMAGRTGRYSTLDPNNVGNLPGTYSGTVRSQVASDIAGTEGSGVRKALSYGYQGVMGAADSLARAALGGGSKVIPLGLAAAGSFGQTMSEASGQGASPTQAVALATANAFLEVGTEYLPLDNLLKTAKGGAKGAGAAIKKALKQGGMEIIEEEASFLGSLAAEAAILREKSGYNQQIGDLVAGGMSYQEAKEQADRAVWDEAVQTAIVSGISGGISSAGASVAADLTDTGKADAQDSTPKAAKPDPVKAVLDAVNRLSRKDGGSSAEATAEQTVQSAEDASRKQMMEAARQAFEKWGIKSDGAKQEINKKTGSITTPESVQADSFTPEATGGTAPVETDVPGKTIGRGPSPSLISVSENSITDGDGVVNGDSSGMDHGAVGAASHNFSSNGEYGSNTVGSAESKFPHEVRRSKVYDNTYTNATGETTRAIGAEAEKQNPHVAEYDYVSEKESVYNAAQRVRQKGTDTFAYSPEDVQEEYEYLVGKDGWTGEDNDTAMMVLNYFMKTGDVEKLRDLAKVQKEQGTTGGQLVQSFAKYSRSAARAAADAVNSMDDFSEKDVASRYYRNKPGDTSKQRFESWKADVMRSMLDIGNEIENTPNGDAKGMQDIVRQLANFRRTTAWAGNSSRLTRAADRIVGKLDYDTAKDIAIAQLSMIPDDFRKRSAGERVKTIRIQNMLSALTTVNRNLAGNATTGMMDAVSDSTGGRMMDMLMSKFTGKRTVGNDVRYAKEYFTAAKDAADMAALCVELDIPMETEAAYSIGNTRSYSPNSGPVTRFFSAYEKYLKYALEVSDKFFEGGTKGAVSKGLQNLGEKSGLTQAEISTLAQKAGERRTFKEGRGLAQANTKLKEALNYIGTENIGAGDVLIPFAGVPGDVAQVGVDYTGGGLIEGFSEIAGVIRDARAGKKIDAYRQRKAATDFGRGVTGVGLVATFTTLAAMGAIGVHDDEDRDKNALEQSMGLSGAQFNVDAAIRAMRGENAEWLEDDLTVSFDFLEPFNALMYVGYLTAQEDTVLDMVKEYPKNAFRGVLQSVLDMPMMQTFSNIADIVSSLTEVTEDGDYSAVYDAAGKMAGDTLTGFIPSWMRQTAQYIDPYYRDTTGENAMEKAVNQFKAAVPFASRTLPKKYDGLGNEQLRYENPSEGFFDTFISPTDSGRIKGNEIADFLAGISQKTGDKNVYPEYTAPKSFKVNGEDFAVTGQLRETYQKTYGDNITALYGELIASDDFAKLNDKQQAEALRKAKEYATQFAKAAVSDYSDVQDGTARELSRSIIQKQVTGKFTDAFELLVENWDEGTDQASAVNYLEEAARVYDSLNTRTKAVIRNEASGRLEYYLEARAVGIKTETFAGLYRTFRDIDQSNRSTSEKAQKWAYELQKAKEAGTITEKQKDTLKKSMVYYQNPFPAETEKFDQMTEAGLTAKKALDIGALVSGIKPAAGYKSVRDWQKAEKIAGANLTESEKRAVMKLYLSDAQDENLDQMIGMGYDADDYAAIYRIYSGESGDGKKKRTIDKIREELGVDEATAKRIYEIYG